MHGIFPLNVCKMFWYWWSERFYVLFEVELLDRDFDILVRYPLVISKAVWMHQIFWTKFLVEWALNYSGYAMNILIKFCA